MPPASPRKSSTSSGRPERPRARYLGVEAAGEPVPSSCTILRYGRTRSGRRERRPMAGGDRVASRSVRILGAASRGPYGSSTAAVTASMNRSLCQYLSESAGRYDLTVAEK